MPNTNLKRSEVLDRAKTAANSVKPKPAPWIVVTEVSRPDLVRPQTVEGLASRQRAAPHLEDTTFIQ